MFRPDFHPLIDPGYTDEITGSLLLFIFRLNALRCFR